jgi:hypothetical protein
VYRVGNVENMMCSLKWSCGNLTVTSSVLLVNRNENRRGGVPLRFA